MSSTTNDHSKGDNQGFSIDKMFSTKYHFSRLRSSGKDLLSNYLSIFPFPRRNTEYTLNKTMNSSRYNLPIVVEPSTPKPSKPIDCHDQDKPANFRIKKLVLARPMEIISQKGLNTPKAKSKKMIVYERDVRFLWKKSEEKQMICQGKVVNSPRAEPKNLLLEKYPIRNFKPGIKMENNNDAICKESTGLSRNSKRIIIKSMKDLTYKKCLINVKIGLPKSLDDYSGDAPTPPFCATPNHRNDYFDEFNRQTDMTINAIDKNIYNKEDEKTNKSVNKFQRLQTSSPKEFPKINEDNSNIKSQARGIRDLKKLILLFNDKAPKKRTGPSLFSNQD